jgi:hypothetical protein
MKLVRGTISTMPETKREACWTAGGAYSEVSWDPDTGCSEVRDFDVDGHLIARHEWELFAEPVGDDGIAGEHRTFDAEGAKVAAKAITAPAT